MSIKQKKITKETAINRFNTLGLCLIMYCLLVMVLPSFLNKYLVYRNSEIILNPVLHMSVSFLFLTFGTIIPCVIIMSAFKIKFADFYQKTTISTKQIRDEAVIFVLAVSIAIFASTSIASFLGKEGSIILNIGSTLQEEYYGSFFNGVIFIFFAPLIEEFAFRGVLLKSLSSFGKYFALIVSSIVYALAHESFIEMIPAFVMAYYLGKISLASSSIQPCVIIHIIFNALFYILGILPSRIAMYVTIILDVLYIIAIIKVFTNKHLTVSIKYSKDSLKVFKTAFKSPMFTLSLVVFIVHSVFEFIR